MHYGCYERDCLLMVVLNLPMVRVCALSNLVLVAHPANRCTSAPYYPFKKKHVYLNFLKNLFTLKILSRYNKTNHNF